MVIGLAELHPARKGSRRNALASAIVQRDARRVSEPDPSLAECLGWLLELRLRVRRDRESPAIVDRCIAICGKATTADAAEMARLNAQVSEIADSLALRFGAPRNTVIQ